MTFKNLEVVFFLFLKKLRLNSSPSIRLFEGGRGWERGPISPPLRKAWHSGYLNSKNKVLRAHFRLIAIQYFPIFNVVLAVFKGQFTNTDYNRADLAEVCRENYWADANRPARFIKIRGSTTDVSNYGDFQPRTT